MALVLYERAVAGASNEYGHPVLPIGGQQLAPWVHSPQSQAVLALPGQDVPFVRGAISGNQIMTHRPSYINALLIQSRGRREEQACSACRDGPRLRPFPECARVPGHFGGAYGNCKWRDHTARCSVRDQKGGTGGSHTGSQQRPPPPPSLGGGAGGASAPHTQTPSTRPRALITDGSTPSFAIVID